jgi:Ca2+/H+ antiporter, TMEM165/GDT1 family
MQNVITTVRKLVGLFVDDGSLAAVVLVWIATCGLLLRIVGLVPQWLGAMLFLGLALILFENALRAAKRRSVT